MRVHACVRACACACARACVRACVRACMYERERGGGGTWEAGGVEASAR